MSPIKVLDHISPTSLASFSDCRLQWYWSGPLGYRRVERQAAFDLGIGVHLALAAFYGAQMRGKMIDPVTFFEQWADAEIAKLENFDNSDIQVMAEVRTMGISILEGYVLEYQNEELEVLAVEKAVSRPLPGTDWSIDVRIDAIVRDHLHNRQVFVLEHKTFSSFTEHYLDKDHQFVAEVWCARDLIEDPVVGLIYNGMRKAIPGPRTKAKMFERRHLYINDNQIKVFQKRARGMYNDLTRGSISIYPEPNVVRCGMCPFKEVCSEYQRGGDYEYMLNTLFAKRGDPR